MALVEAVVIAGDRARADVRARADARIADIGQMIDLRTALDRRLLDLDEVADVSVLGDVRAGAQPRIRPEDRTGGDARVLEVAEALDRDVVVITSYSIHYTKLYEAPRRSCASCAATSSSASRPDYSTVTLFARLRGWSTSVPLSDAMW